MKKNIYKLSGIDCANCAQKIEDKLNKNKESINSSIEHIDRIIGSIDDSSKISFYGKYNDLIENSNKIYNFVGSSDSTLSESIENIIICWYNQYFSYVL